MHSERYEIPEKAAQAINAARATDRRVIAVGTTTLRALESAAEAPQREFAPARAKPRCSSRRDSAFVSSICC